MGQDIILLGSGGTNPRVDMIDPSGHHETITVGPHGHSIYSLDVCPETASLAFGTRTGLIHILPDALNPMSDRGSPRSICLYQGAPVLSICWVGRNLLFASDLSGRVLLWDLTDKENPEVLPTKRSTVCAFCRLPQNKIAGLCSNGELLIWSTPELRPIQTHSLLSPPSKLAIVHLCYWPLAEALIYPAKGGVMAGFTLENAMTWELQAHDDEFYAFCIHDGMLITGGLSDRCIKIWEGTLDSKAIEFPVGVGVIGLYAFVADHSCIVAVDEDGKAWLYGIDAHDFNKIRLVPGDDYRTAEAFSYVHRQILSKEEWVSQLVARIETCTEKEDQLALEAIHNRLVNSGYEHISLAIRAESAMQSDNFIEALWLNNRLIELLPADDDRTRIFLERQVQLLSRFWRIEESLDICDKIATCDSNAYEEIRNWTPISRELLDQPRLIESEEGLEDLIEASDIIGCCFEGSYVMRKLPPLVCEDVRISADYIASKFNSTKDQTTHEQGHVAIPERILWVSSQGVLETEMVFFEGGAGQDGGLQLAMQVRSAEAQTVITPVILFFWIMKGPSRTVNVAARNALKNARQQPQSFSDIDAAYKTAIQVIRRSVTETKPGREARF